jgi:hypothetical protein
LNEEVFAILAEARAVIERWRIDYNHVKPHSAHGGIDPGGGAAEPRGRSAAQLDQLRPLGRSRRRSRSAINSLGSHNDRGTRGGRLIETRLKYDASTITSASAADVALSTARKRDAERWARLPFVWTMQKARANLRGSSSSKFGIGDDIHQADAASMIQNDIRSNGIASHNEPTPRRNGLSTLNRAASFSPFVRHRLACPGAGR